jgi:hypothetical protein
MEDLRAQRIFSFDRPIEEVKVVRKTRKVNRKNAPKIPRKTLSKVEQDLKVSYRKYVNSIRRKKSCRVKSFRAFANARMGKKSRRSSRSVKSPVVPMPVPLPESMPESTPVVSPSESASPSVEAPAPEEMSLPESTPETTPVASPVEAESPSVAQAPEEASTETPSSEAPASESEQKPTEEGGILKSVTDAFGLSSKEEVKKTGGRKRKGNSRHNKKRNSRK